MTDVTAEKNVIRQRVWDILAEHGVVPHDVHGHIPTFVGADLAADRLAGHPAWHAARTIKANPDTAQHGVRSRVLTDGKLLYMAVPRLAGQRPFYELNPSRLGVPLHLAATSATAARIAMTVDVATMRPVDLVVCGSVAVNHQGIRLGKGAGYSDIEVALLADAGLITDHTVFVTTVHPLQVLDEPIPTASHDFRVDLIVTPNEIIDCHPPHRRTTIEWDNLAPDTINAIPALAARRFS